MTCLQTPAAGVVRALGWSLYSAVWHRAAGLDEFQASVTEAWVRSQDSLCEFVVDKVSL
jgi:hypothetical protein